ncbi:ceramidase [Emydomyces testavorans]|uniref:Neutral ceramidase n=1 Tax=Emydomyces testavorans TaxID=2070801 RepID=A0AAF0DBT1_9EURO|nr:ceramidase [Emydomyces testavorans]
MARFGIVVCLLSVFLGTVFVLQQFANPGFSRHPRWFASTRMSSRSGPTSTKEDGDAYLLGVGKADVTGMPLVEQNAYYRNEQSRPVVEVPFMGYAYSEQIGSGLRQRIYSRAFIVGDRKKPENRFVYIVLDTAAGDTAIRDGVLRGLAELGGDYEHYGQHNVAVTGTHSHAGPGAWLNYLIPQISTKGFDKQSYQAIVDGTILSIKRAHEAMVPGRLSFATSKIDDGNINRSPFAYLNNPADERARYDSDTDKTFSMLRFDRLEDKKTIGVLTFYSVHGTSLYRNNTLVAGDNKGVAAILFEQTVRDDQRFAKGFVAGFSQSSVGDVSPNILGAFCEDTGLPCKFDDSTCNGKSELCHGRGPFFREQDEGAKSCFEIGRRQYFAAKKLYDKMGQNAASIQGPSVVSSFHTFQDFSNYTFNSPFDQSRELTTCSAALGFGFAGGTTDGPGYFDFTQNGTDSPSTKNPVWKIARDILHPPTPQQTECHKPKKILLDVGELTFPYQWTPNIVDIQVLRVGPVLIVVSSGEATTMAGRRWKAAIAQSATRKLNIPDPIVLLGGPANTYVHYITTEEEYHIQRYEGASTLHGPFTLAAHVNVALTYLPHLAGDSTSPPVPPGPSPQINTDRSLSFITGVVLDTPPIGKSFGDVLAPSPEGKTFRPGDTVFTSFVGANPRNNLRLEGTYATVEREIGKNKWEVARDDADWNLTYHWGRKSPGLATSEVTIEWLIEDDYYSVGTKKTKSGTYRMVYYGDAKGADGKIRAFKGIGPRFTVSA